MGLSVVQERAVWAVVPRGVGPGVVWRLRRVLLGNRHVALWMLARRESRCSGPDNGVEEWGSPSAGFGFGLCRLPSGIFAGFCRGAAGFRAGFLKRGLWQKSNTLVGPNLCDCCTTHFAGGAGFSGGSAGILGAVLDLVFRGVRDFSVWGWGGGYKKSNSKIQQGGTDGVSC